MSNYDIIQKDVYSVESTFNEVCADKNLSFVAEAGFAIQSLMASEYSMKIAAANRQSVINAVTNVAAIGISLNPARKQAYLVPRDGKICLDISYMGLMDLAIQSGSIRWAQCALVHSADEFSLNGLDKQPIHKFNPFSKARGDLIGVYCVVKTSDGDYLTHSMAIEDVFSIRDRSSAWIAVQNKKAKSCPWLTDEGEMVKKTCIKQAQKYWPKSEQSGRMERAIHYLNEQAGEGLQKVEDSSKGFGHISATDGAMAALSVDVQNYLREFSSECSVIFAEVGAAAAFDRIKADELDNDQSVAFWSLLSSDMRSALKRERQARKEAAAAVGAA